MRIQRDPEKLLLIGGDGTGNRYTLVPGSREIQIQTAEKARLVTNGPYMVEGRVGINEDFLAEFEFDQKTGVWKMKGPKGQMAKFHKDKAGWTTDADQIFEGPRFEDIQIMQGSPIDVLRYAGVKEGQGLAFGRADEYSNYMPYESNVVSGRHFSLSRTGDVLGVKDLGSSNGTYICVIPATETFMDGPNRTVEINIPDLTEKQKARINKVLERAGEATL